MNILVTGGAGYIGSSITKKLVENDHQVVVIDNLSRGREELVHPDAVFVKGDLVDKKGLKVLFRQHHFDQVIHLAAYKDSGESMENPARYSDNIRASLNLLEAMTEFKVSKIVFSSTAAVYGEPRYLPIDEQHSTVPTNYYGFTKLETEEFIQWYGRLKGIQYVILRYFNVAGDAGLHYVEQNPGNLIPILMNVLTGHRKVMTVFGNDYPTRDGTCIRDYIDLNDLTEAHLKALTLDSDEIINLGTAQGLSVSEIIRMVAKETGEKFSVHIGPRRPGDVATIVADFKKARRLLGWQPMVSSEAMIESMWHAYSKRNDTQK